MDLKPRQIEIYKTSKGREPFDQWLSGMRDRQGRAAIRARLERVEDGNFGKIRSLGDGVHEIKVDFGPGYRVYYGLDGPVIVLLLCGGDKGSQTRDIRLAKQYWNDYLKRGA